MSPRMDAHIVAYQRLQKVPPIPKWVGEWIEFAVRYSNIPAKTIASMATRECHDTLRTFRNQTGINATRAFRVKLLALTQREARHYPAKRLGVWHCENCGEIATRCCLPCDLAAGLLRDIRKTNPQDDPKTLPIFDCEPTGAIPGSQEKVNVLRARLEARQQLYHPMDAKGAVLPRTMREYTNIEPFEEFDEFDDMEDDYGV